LPLPAFLSHDISYAIHLTSGRVHQRGLAFGTGLGRVMDQESSACDPRLSARPRPSPALVLLGRSLEAIVAVVTSLLVADPVGPHCRVMEQGRALRRRVPLGKPFEGVEQDVVGERHLIHREVTFKHAAVRAKLLNAVRHEGRHRLRQLV
jgi:hypothetical protein